ncbi:hypothetical protein [Bosea sp. (in: a-proteobacteria)]|uniref:hypothetical protein n=1 Tax=Bosea sp. (in: a-proteobacteria) TaxID=1871050 RepID=UPI003B3A0BF4
MTPAEKRSAWIQAARRRNEMIRFGIDRAGSGMAVDARRFAFAAAVTLASAPAGRFRVRGKFCTWHGLDGPSLVELLRKAKVAEVGCGDDLIGWILGKVRPGPPLTPEAAGELLALRADERERLAIRSMEAVDEPRIEREAREREQRKAKDRLRKGRARPGSKRHEASLARQEPWRDAGVSRATWFRRRNETVLSAKTNAETALSAETYSGRETDLSVRLKFPGTHVVKGEADRTVSRSQEAALSDRLQRSEPSTGPSLGAGFGVANGSPIGASAESYAPGRQIGLPDGSQLESEAPKKETARLGRTVPDEDPREMLAAVFPDRNEQAWLVEELGDGDTRSGWRLIAALGVNRLRRLRVEIDAAGGMTEADAVLAAARTAAISIETLAVRRAAS